MGYRHLRQHRPRQMTQLQRTPARVSMDEASPRGEVTVYWCSYGSQALAESGYEDAWWRRMRGRLRTRTAPCRSADSSKVEIPNPRMASRRVRQCRCRWTKDEAHVLISSTASRRRIARCAGVLLGSIWPNPFWVDRPHRHGVDIDPEAAQRCGELGRPQKAADTAETRSTRATPQARCSAN